uniref:Uncharacterized protein n=1 Tax=Parascaris univalens TaxID=6257 RepID=A0A915BDR4_PARUN
LFSVTIAEEHEQTRKKRQNPCVNCGTASSQQGYVNYPVTYQSPQYQPTYQTNGQYTNGQQYPTSYLNPTGQTYQYQPTYQYTSSQQYQTQPQYQPVQYQAPQYQPVQYQPTQYQPTQYQQSFQQPAGCGGSSCSCPGGFTICFHYYGPNRCCSKK